jgi:hypothetical protein
MKNLYILFICCLSLILFSCSDPCQDVDCNTNGYCDDGMCICDPGFAGKNCKIQTCSTDFFVGTYSGTLVCSNGDYLPLVITFTKISETELMWEDQDGNTAFLKLDLRNCTARKFDTNILVSRTIELRYTSSGIEFEIESSSAFSEKIICTGKLLS